YIKSWDDVKGDFADLKYKNDSDILSDAETMEQLIELGYIERLDDKVEKAVKKTECDLKHNLARVHLGKKNYAQAESILLELIQENEPIDTSPYYMDLVNINLENENYDEAQKYLDELKNHKTPVKY